MRPKKVILCVDTDPVRLHCRTFVFQIRGYAVYPVSSVAAALARFRACTIDAVVAPLELEADCSGDDLARQMWAINSVVPVLLTSDCLKVADHVKYAAAMMTKGWAQTELLERVRILAGRKRGPKKQAVSVPTGVALAEVG